MHGLQEKYVSSIFYRDYTMLSYNTAMRTLYDVHVFLNERVKYKEFINPSINVYIPVPQECFPLIEICMFSQLMYGLI